MTPIKVKKAVQGHTRPHKAIQGHSIPWCTTEAFMKKFCSLAYFLYPCTIFVRFGTCSAHDSPPTLRTTTTKLLLGPLSIARGQKVRNIFSETHFRGHFAQQVNFSSRYLIGGHGRGQVPARLSGTRLIFFFRPSYWNAEAPCLFWQLMYH